MHSFSAHADEPGLLDFIGKLDRGRLKRIFMVHGAPKRQAAFQTALEAQGYANIAVPDYGDSVVLD